MSKKVVTIDGVWKKFRTGERHDSLRDLIPSVARGLFGRRRAQDLGDEEFWALKDVSFEVGPGEALGVIGPNGAGKSTLLKVLTRILKPTRGHCHVRGRVGALIEIAAGFHPDLTGRENVYLQGAVMGMRRAEISERFDEIVEFSGVGGFIDTPVKRYSSGMQARLGFSIAAHLNPDVLFVDEVLSVGDMTFQARCLERMTEFIRSGLSVIFVSHNLPAVARLCNRTIVIRQGGLVFDGSPAEGFGFYMKASRASWARRQGAGKPRFKLISAELRAGGSDVNLVPSHSLCELRVRFECLEPCPPFNIGFEIERTSDMVYCYAGTSQEMGQPLFQVSAGDTLTAAIQFRAHLTSGHYQINVNLRDPNGAAFLLYCDNVASFGVDDSQTSVGGVTNVEPSLDVVDSPAVLSEHGAHTA